MHFWIDKRSQSNINQCRANARLTLNRLQPLEYVRPPHQHQHHTNYSNSYCSSNIRNNPSSSNTNRNISRNSSSSNNSSNYISPGAMINTAATSSAHTNYRNHHNIDIEPSFGSNQQHVVRSQPHLRWQVLVIFTFFVVTVRFYLLGNRSEVLIYCISGLILVIALLIFSALNLQKKLTTNNNTNTNMTSPRFEGIAHSRLLPHSSRTGNISINTNNNHTNPNTHRYQYAQQLILQNSNISRVTTNRDAQLLAEAVVLLPPSPTQLFQDNPYENHNIQAECSIAPPPYDMAILLPADTRVGGGTKRKFHAIEMESSEDETPPPSYEAVTDLNN